MSQPVQNVFDMKLSPRVLVEASAGTGKTYTIVGLVIRLLVEKELQPSEILVVTFTRMATKELKDRILLRLQRARDALENRDAGDDPFLKNMLVWSSDHPKAGEIITQAVQNFDDAQIYTIHGFCQKILSEEALLANVPFQFELENSNRYLREFVYDLWRNYMDRFSRSASGKFVIHQILETWPGPDKLFEQISTLIAKSYAEITFPDKIDLTQTAESFFESRNKLECCWADKKSEILNELNLCGIKGTTQNMIDNTEQDIDAFVADDNPLKTTFRSLDKVTSEKVSDPENLNNNETRVAHHTFFNLCSAYKQKLEQLHLIKSSFLEELYHFALEKLSHKLSETGRLNYQDLLKAMCDALRDEDTGSEFSKRIRDQFPIALVDEFQDTDPMQNFIFDQIYAADAGSESMLLMIGDPKQSIYAFRGADIYSYIRARKSVKKDRRYTLNQNYRSTKPYIEAVNSLFSVHDKPYLDSEIEFIPSEKGGPTDEKGFLLNGNPVKPISFYCRKGIYSKKEAVGRALEHTSNSVANLLIMGQTGEAQINGKKVNGGDIAILIHTHKDAEMLKDLLKERGVDSVTYTPRYIFGTKEADMIRQLMTTVLDPEGRSHIQNLLVSGFFGSDLLELNNWTKNDSKREELQNLMHDLLRIWEKEGFYPMYRKFMFGENAITRLSILNKSERILTNLQQLSEHCAKAERDERFEPAELLYWFKKMQADTDRDEDQMRLESDGDLVKISTIHNSKGLQFPIVFCPTLWSVNEFKDLPVAEFHSAGTNRELNIRVDFSDSQKMEEARQIERFESVAEDVRKSYVALTRAKYCCYIYWTAIKSTIFSGISPLLIDRESIMDSINNKSNLKSSGLEDSCFIDALNRLATKQPGLFEFELDDDQPLEPMMYRHSDQVIDIEARRWPPGREIESKRELYSFSSLVHHQDEDESEPDHDQWLERYLNPKTVINESAHEENLFGFPRGAAAGTLIHHLFEDDSFDFYHQSEASIEWIEDVLQSHGFDKKWSRVLQMMLNTVSHADIGPFSLNQIEPSKQIREMEFYLPTGNLDIEPVYQLIRGNQISKQNKYSIEGWLKGFVDLTLEWEGRYYILDYKSNYLGDSFEDYKKADLKQAVFQAGYDVQYHFYTLALVRYLRTRLHNFDYDKHIGGSVYLFVRGMQENSGNGVWFHRPDKAVIDELEHLLERS